MPNTTDSQNEFQDELHGLAMADPDTVRKITAIALPVVKERIASAGGSATDCSVFFKTAMVSLGKLIREQKILDGQKAESVLPELAALHFAQWSKERSENQEVEAEAPANVPKFNVSEEDLRLTRNHIFVWNQLEEVPEEERTAFEAWIVADPETRAELPSPDFEYYSTLFHFGGRAPGEWPDWLEAAIRDSEGRAMWAAAELAEEETQRVPVPESRANKIIRNVFIVSILGFILYNGVSYLLKPKVPAEVFEDNFAPPKSLLTDAAKRFETEQSDSLFELRQRCSELLHEADVYYSKGEYSEAQDPLLLLTMDENSVCQSDGYFYLGIIRLQMDDPGLALQCFSKIEDIEAFGEDIYWYQALCFVKLAEHNPDLRDRAARAVERFLSNTRDEKRRALAEEMFEDLSK
jgi:hypothetical protein